MAFKNFLQGITKETFDCFSGRTNGPNVLSFVRRDKDADKGSIFFGERQYATSDFQSKDQNLLVEYLPYGGLDINQNLAADYTFSPAHTLDYQYQKVLYLPDGSYTLIVEMMAGGNISSNITNIAVNAVYHNEYCIGKEILSYYAGGHGGFYVVIPTAHPMAPYMQYKIKVISSTEALKGQISVLDNSFCQGAENKGVHIIPCLTNNSNVVITTGDSTYVTTAETTIVEGEAVGACKIVTNDSIMDYIIYTDGVDDNCKISAKTYSDSGLTEVTDIADGIYRFKFTDTVTNGFVLAGQNSSYSYTGDIYANSILTLSLDDDYAVWTLDKPQIYSSGNTVDISMDSDGGFNLEVPVPEFDFDITAYDLQLPSTEMYTQFLLIPTCSSSFDVWRLSLVCNDSSAEKMYKGEVIINGNGEIKCFGTMFPYAQTVFFKGVTEDNYVLYIKNANAIAPLYMKMLSAPDNEWAWGDLTQIDTEDISLFASDVKSEISPDVTNNPYSNYNGDTEVSVPTVQAVLDWTMPMLSGVSYDGEIVPVEDRIAKIVSMKPSYDGQYKYSLLTSFFGLRGKLHNYCIPLLTARVRANNGEKFNIGFRIHSTSCDNRNFTGEYFYDSHNVQEFERRSTFGCLDFSERNYITGDGTYGEPMDHAQWDDIFMTVEPNGSYGYEGRLTEYKVVFYKRCLTDYSMFNLELDYVHGGNVQVDFHSYGYYSDEAIQSSLFGVENTTYKEDFGQYKFTHSRSVPVLITDIETQYEDSLYFPTDFREGQGGANDCISGITINNSTEGVSISEHVADLYVKDWKEEISFLSGKIDTLIDSLNTKGNSGGSGGGGSQNGEIAQLWQEIYTITAQIQTLQSQINNAGCTAITYSDGTKTHTKEIDDDHVIDLGVLTTGGGKNTQAYIDETGEWLWVYSRKTGKFERISVSVLSVNV